MSQRDVIMTKVVELLEAADATNAVHRHAMRPFDKDRLPAIVPYITSVKPIQDAQTWGMRGYEMEVRIEARTTGTPVDQVLDPMIATIQQVMLSEPFLGGTAFNVKEGETQFDALDRDKTYCAAALDFTVTFYEDPTGLGEEPLEPAQMGDALSTIEVTP
nr:hypothetical protein [uncultured Holophaga sp.]